MMQTGRKLEAIDATIWIAQASLYKIENQMWELSKILVELPLIQKPMVEVSSRNENQEKESNDEK